MKFYLNLTMHCEKCGHKSLVLLGQDKVVWHECNQGNEGHNVPKLKELMGIRRKP